MNELLTNFFWYPKTDIQSLSPLKTNFIIQRPIRHQKKWSETKRRTIPQNKKIKWATRKSEKRVNIKWRKGFEQNIRIDQWEMWKKVKRRAEEEWGEDRK